jgi:hypothetical protein
MRLAQNVVLGVVGAVILTVYLVGFVGGHVVKRKGRER